MKRSTVMKASRARRPVSRWGAGKEKNTQRSAKWISGYGAAFVARAENETATKHYRRSRRIKRRMVAASRRRNRPHTQRGGM